jgi:monoterpene epsilon-lactone hydrolase
MTSRRARRKNPARTGLRLPPAVVRLGVRQIGRRVLDPSLSWDAQRRRLDRLNAGSPLPRGTTVAERVTGGVRSKIVTAGPVSEDRAVVHFHGGGYCVGSAGTARAWAAHLSAVTGCRVVLPEYRLAPEHPHPAALDDARKVMNMLLDEVAPGSLVLSGDSAGAGLALAATLAMRDENAVLPAGCILLSPWLDLSADRHAVPELVRRDVLLSPRWLDACATAYAKPANWTEQSVSPLLAGHDGLPPLLIQAGSDDLLAPDAERLAASASAAGVDVTYTIWPRMWHDFVLQPGLVAAADSALSQAAWFVQTVTAS